MKLTCSTQFIVLVALSVAGLQAETNSIAEAEAAYTRTITQRADTIVATLSVAETNKFVRVRDIIAQQYRNLSKIHEARDAQIKAAKEKSGPDKAAADAAAQAARDEIKPRLDKLHNEFLAKLATELSPEQVDKVKDGMTYGVVQVTYNAYVAKHRQLTAEEKKQIMTWLIEARELAMDQGSSAEKHAVFGKYKGRINNFLVKAGYDLKTGEQNLKKPAAPPPAKLN